MKGSFSSHEVKVILDGKTLESVSSLDSSFSTTYESMDIMGMGTLCHVPKRESEGSFTVERFVVNEDLAKYVLDTPVSGGIKYGEWGSFSKNLAFASGYLSSYSMTASVGVPPVSSMEFSVYGEMAQTDSLDSTGSWNDNEGFINNGGIILTAADVQYDNAQSVSMSFSVPRKKNTSLFSEYPTLEEIEWPVEVSVNISIDVDEFEHPNTRSFIEWTDKAPIVITLNDYQDGSNIAQYTIPSPKLQGVNYRLSAGGKLEASIDYICYINSFDGLIT